MAPVTLRVALVGGPAYDPLYLGLPDIEARLGVRIEVGLQSPHPELNNAVETAGRNGPLPFDLISTHIKYAPSQDEWLRPLDDLVSADELAAFAPGLLAHCRFQGTRNSREPGPNSRVLPRR
jgi:multiple sugar transport system substrate-binding protein